MTEDLSEGERTETQSRCAWPQPGYTIGTDSRDPKARSDDDAPSRMINTVDLLLEQRISVNPTCTLHQSAAQDLAMYVKLKRTQATLSSAKIEREGWSVADTAARVRDHGLTIDSIYQPSWFDLADEATWVPLQQRMIRAIEVAAEFEAPLQITTGGSMGMPYQRGLEAFRRAIGPVLAEAHKHHVAIWLEPTRPQFANVSIVHTLGDSLRVMSELGPGAQVVFDVTHCWWEPTLDGLLRSSAAHIGSVHLADLNLAMPSIYRQVPGDGHLPLGHMLSQLLAGGYAGIFEIEVLGPAIEREGTYEAIKRSIDFAAALIERVAAQPAPSAHLDSDMGSDNHLAGTDGKAG